MSFKLSKSKVNSFLKCPREFQYSYIDEIQRPPNKFMKIGTDVHQIAEDFIAAWANNQVDDILEYVLKLSAKYEDNYETHAVNLASFFQSIFVDEDYKIFMAEEYLFSEKYNFSGLADLVLEDDNGKLIVIDYKTGKTGSIKNYRLELCYYKMLLEDLYPDKEVVCAGIFFTKKGDCRFLMFSDEEIKGARCNTEDYQAAIQLLDHVRVEIEEENFQPKKQFLCNYCQYQDLCKKDGGI